MKYELRKSLQTIKIMDVPMNSIIKYKGQTYLHLGWVEGRCIVIHEGDYVMELIIRVQDLVENVGRAQTITFNG